MPSADWIRSWHDGEERLRGAWNDADGLVFLDRERSRDGSWIAPRAEPSGVHSFYFQATSHVQCGEFNGTPQRGLCPAGALQFVQPDESVHPAGEGATRFLHVMLSPRFVDERLDGSVVLEPRDRGRRNYRGDLGIGELARAHEAGLDLGLSGQQLYFETLRHAMLERVLQLYGRWDSRTTSSDESLAPYRTRRVVDYVETHLADDLRLEQLAGVAGLSKFHFARAFRDALGMSPHAFVVHRRLARALALVRRQHAVSDVARWCGFADHAHLTRAFKSRFGATPSMLRAQA
jgi:AraC-like DNA-binding protein